jgi:hypothetical protein
MHKIAAASLSAAATLFGAASCNTIPPNQAACDTPNTPADIDVTGTYRYSSPIPFMISGTIIFEQSGDTVRILNTTYDNNVPNRALMGEAQLNGNTLDIAMVPTNGDTDYRADVRFVFSDDGDTFCVEFSDTNNDTGALGSFTGQRQAAPNPEVSP